MEGHSKKYFRNISPKYHDYQPKICEICQSWKESRGHGKQQKTQSKTKQKQQKTYSSILGVLLSRKGMLGGWAWEDLRRVCNFLENNISL